MSDEEFFSMDFDDEQGMAFRTPSAQALLSPPIISGYLAVPLSNNSHEVHKECAQLREIIKRLLEAYDYLGMRFVVYDPADVTPPGSSFTDEQVYEIDHDRTAGADLVIFCVIAPSLGVGSESQIAADATLPRVTIAKKGTPVSSMFKGIFSPSIADFLYDDCAEFEVQFSKSLAMIARRSVESARRRRPLIKDFSADDLGRRIFAQRIIRNLPIGQLADLTDTKESWLRRLERSQKSPMCISLIQLARIGDALQCHVAASERLIATLRPHDKSLEDDEKKSLENLITAVLESRVWVEDITIFEVWNKYREDVNREQLEAVAHRGGGSQEIGVEQWKRLLFPDSLYT